MAKPKTPKPHPVIKWLRTAGISAELLGWGGLLLAGQFWFAVGAIYFGFVLLALDAWFEPDLKSHPRWKVALVLALVIAAGIFSWVFVFVSAPLGVSIVLMNAEYPPGTKIAGISFGPQFTELRLVIKNGSTRSYEDLNLLIKPTEPIAAVAQLTNVPNVSFSNGAGLSAQVMRRSSDSSTMLPTTLLATDGGYRMRCPHFPAGESIEIVMAIAAVMDRPPESAGPTERNYTIRIKLSDYSSYWIGRADGDVYGPRPKTIQWVEIEGDYNAAQRSRSVAQKMYLNENPNAQAVLQ